MGNIIGHGYAALAIYFWHWLGNTMRKFKHKPPLLKTDEESCTADDTTNDVMSAIKGLPNIGSTCYLNVIIQSLSWTPSFYAMLEKMSMKDTSNEFKLTEKLLVVLHQLRDATSHKQQRKSLKKLLKVVGRKNSQFKSFAQQDSYEMYNLIISEIDEEVQNVQSSFSDCVSVSRLFSGNFITKYQYSGCKHVDVFFQNFTSISVPVIEPKEETDLPRPIKRQRTNDWKREKQNTIDQRSEMSTDSEVNTNEWSLVKTDITVQTENDQQFCNNWDYWEGEKTYGKLVIPMPNMLDCSDTRSKRSNNTNDESSVTIHNDNNMQNDSVQKHRTHESRGSTLPSANDIPVNKTEIIFEDENCREGKVFMNQSKSQSDDDQRVKEKYNEATQHIRNAKRKLNQDEPLTDVEFGLKLLMKTEEHDAGLFTCRQCGDNKDTGCCKTMNILVPPPVLVLQINRFKQEGNGCLRKIQNRMTYPEFLDITELGVIDREAFQVWDESNFKSMKYRIFSVVCHKGSMNGGHYFTYIRTTSDDKRQFNAMVEQNILSDQNKDEIKKYFQGQTRDKPFSNRDDVSFNRPNENGDWYYCSDMCTLKSDSKEALNSDCAYMLFYERV